MANPLASAFRRLAAQPAVAARSGVRGLRHRVIVVGAMARRTWSRSLQLRMVTITLLVSSLLVGAFGYLVVARTTADLLRSAEDTGVEQVNGAVEYVRNELDWHSHRDEASLRTTLLEVRRWLHRPEHSSGPLVALASPDEESTRIVSTGGVDLSPVLTPELVEGVTGGRTGSQIITAGLVPDAAPLTYLVRGSPVPTRWGGQFELYYVFPLTDEARLADEVRRNVLVMGIALVLLLVVVTGLVTRLVVRPVRLAARTAQRLSAGLLDQRMTVVGEDDLALLAASFNQMAENLQRQIVRLEEMSRLQRRFTSDVSHELRTPLTTVRMAADLIFAERDAYPPEVARSAELLQHELNRFESLLTDLLEISRFDAGFAALDGEATDLVPVVRRAVDRLAPLAGRAGVQVQLRVPDTAVIAEVDPRRVDRILRNLIGNAVEHGEGRPVEVTLAGAATAVAVTVRDYGVGLRHGEEKLVFNRFWRADTSRARHTGGTGLGLSISLEDARLHGGWLESWGAPGQGAQFRLTLPVRAGDRLVSSPLPLEPVNAAAPSADLATAAAAAPGAASDTGTDTAPGAGTDTAPGAGTDTGPDTGPAELARSGAAP